MQSTIPCCPILDMHTRKLILLISMGINSRLELKLWNIQTELRADESAEIVAWSQDSCFRSAWHVCKYSEPMVES